MNTHSRDTARLLDVSSDPGVQVIVQVGPFTDRMRHLVPSGGAQAVGVSTTSNVASPVDGNYGGYYAWDSTDPAP